MNDYELSTSLSQLETKLEYFKQNSQIYANKNLGTHYSHFQILTFGKTWDIQSCIQHIMRSLAGLQLYANTRKQRHHEYVPYEENIPQC